VAQLAAPGPPRLTGLAGAGCVGPGRSWPDLAESIAVNAEKKEKQMINKRKYKYRELKK
jgi:hypothetical protein